MTTYSLVHVGDAALLRDLATLNTRDRATTAELLAHIAEVEKRRLFAPAGYPSMFAYCVRVLRLSEDMAFKRIRAGRAARKYPAILDAIADGRLHVAAVVVVAPHLRPWNATELLAAAEHKTKAEVERLMAARFPGRDVRARVRALRAGADSSSRPKPEVSNPTLEIGIAPGPQPSCGAPSYQSEQMTRDATASSELVPGPLSFNRTEQEPMSVETRETVSGSATTPRPSNLPHASAPRFALQVTIGEPTHDKLRRAQTLLGHTVPSGDIAQVLDRALDALIAELEKRKFAATSRPRATARGARESGGSQVSRGSQESRRSQKSTETQGSRRPLESRESREPNGSPRKRNARSIAAEVRRQVVQRDGGRCTFVSDSGQRCDEVSMLEFDHIHAVARGGGATLENLRLRCRTHNQYEAERLFGAEFMREKRERALRPQAAEPDADYGVQGAGTRGES